MKKEGREGEKEKYRQSWHKKDGERWDRYGRDKTKKQDKEIEDSDRTEKKYIGEKGEEKKREENKKEKSKEESKENRIDKKQENILQRKKQKR